MYEVKRGQMVTSLESICKCCGKGISIQNVRTALARFERIGFLTNESTKTGRLITICNYCEWQDKDEDTNKDANKDLTKESQRPNKNLTSNNNEKKNKNNKDIYISVPPEICESFFEWSEMRKKIGKPITTANAVTRAINKLHKLSSDIKTQNDIIILDALADRPKA